MSNSFGIINSKLMVSFITILNHLGGSQWRDVAGFFFHGYGVLGS